MEVPIWRYNGYKYEYFKSLSSNDYKQLKRLSLEALQKNPKLLADIETKKLRENPPPNREPKQTKSNPLAKKYILKRWKTIDVIGKNHNGFVEMTNNKETVEMEFRVDKQCIFYHNGIIKNAFQYILASDGNSFLLTSSHEKEPAAFEIISIKPTELVIKSPMYQNDTVILKAN